MWQQWPIEIAKAAHIQKTNDMQRSGAELTVIRAVVLHQVKHALVDIQVENKWEGEILWDARDDIQSNNQPNKRQQNI